MFLFGIERLLVMCSNQNTSWYTVFLVNDILKSEVLTVTKCNKVFSDVQLLWYWVCLRLITRGDFLWMMFTETENPKDHHHHNKIPTNDPAVNLLSLIHITTSCSYKLYFNIVLLYLRFFSSKWPLSMRFPHQNSVCIVCFFIQVTYHARHILGLKTSTKRK